MLTFLDNLFCLSSHLSKNILDKSKYFLYKWQLPTQKKKWPHIAGKGQSMGSTIITVSDTDVRLNTTVLFLAIVQLQTINKLLSTNANFAHCRLLSK